MYDIIAAMGPAVALGVFASILGLFALVVLADLLANFHKHDGRMDGDPEGPGATTDRLVSAVSPRPRLPFWTC